MKHWFYTLIILPVLVNGQNNLVPNGDFETYSTCPNGIGQISNAVPWQNPVSQGTLDYFNACAGNNGLGIYQNVIGSQTPHSGNGYAGLFAFQQQYPSFRECIQVKLIDTLIKGIPYQVSFWASLGDRTNYSISTLGAYLSDTVIDEIEFSSLSLTPQINNNPLYPLNDKENWMLIKDTFTSTNGGELYLTISNFYNDSLSDTLFLNAGPTAGPYAYYYIDDVAVIALDTTIGINEKGENQFTLFPSPVSNILTIEAQSTAKGNLSFISIYDMTGRQIGQWSMVNGKKTIDVSNFAEGVYIIQLQSQQGLVSKKFVKQ